MKINEIDVVYFDLDGVIINSNSIKSKAFEIAVCSYGEVEREKFKIYCKKSGGISRYERFTFFVEKILNLSNSPELVQQLIREYESILSSNFDDVEVDFGLIEIRKILPKAKFYIVTGSKTREAISLMRKLDLINLFDGGIYGSPTCKIDILHELRKVNPSNSIYIGDSAYDYHSAVQNNIHFIFKSDWTEMDNWKSFVQEENILGFKSLTHIGNWLKNL